MAKLKYRQKRNLYFFLIFIGILTALIIWVGFLKNIKKQVEMNYSPKNSYAYTDNLHMEILLNDKLDSHVFSTRLLSIINSAESELIGAIYSLDSVEIRDAFYKAAERGVKVRLILDFKKKVQHTKLLVKIPDNMEIVEVNETAPLESYMHHKYLLADPLGGDPLLFAGSWNWTLLQEMVDPCFAFITSDRYFIQAYNFEAQLLLKKSAGRNKFFENGYQPYNSIVNYPDGYAEIWFSPGIRYNSMNQRLIDLIESANEKIQILVWQVTDKDITDALLEKLKQGVQVTIITDDKNLSLNDSKLPDLQARAEAIGGLEILDDSKRNYEVNSKMKTNDLNSFLHQHTIIIDGKTVAFGTNNWSRNAGFDNDEDMVVTSSPKVVKAFQESFSWHYTRLR